MSKNRTAWLFLQTVGSLGLLACVWRSDPVAKVILLVVCAFVGAGTQVILREEERDAPREREKP